MARILRFFFARPVENSHNCAAMGESTIFTPARANGSNRAWSALRASGRAAAPKITRASARTSGSNLVIARLIKSRVLPGAAIATVVLTAPGLSLSIGDTSMPVLDKKPALEGKISTTIAPSDRIAARTALSAEIAAPSLLVHSVSDPVAPSLTGVGATDPIVPAQDASPSVAEIVSSAPELVEVRISKPQPEAVSNEERIETAPAEVVDASAPLFASGALRNLTLSPPGAAPQFPSPEAEVAQETPDLIEEVASPLPGGLDPIEALGVPKAELAAIPVQPIALSPVGQASPEVAEFAIRPEEKATVSELGLAFASALEAVPGEEQPVRIAAAIPDQPRAGPLSSPVQDEPTELAAVPAPAAAVAAPAERESEPVASASAQVVPRAPTRTETRSAIDPISAVSEAPPVTAPETSAQESTFVPGLKGRPMSAIPGVNTGAGSVFDIKSQLVTRVDGRVAGEIEFHQTGTSLKVRLGSIVELLKDRFEMTELQRIANSSASDV